MKRCPLLVFLLFQFTCAIAQQDMLDSLLKEIPSASRKKQAELYAGIAIRVGNNQPDTALYFANKFNVYDQKKYPSFHSEISAISKVWGKIHIDRSIKMINLRLNAKGELCNSKPCANCSIVINALGLKVWYSKEGKMYHLGD